MGWFAGSNNQKGGLSGKGKHRAIFSNSLNREVEEKQQVGGGGFGARYVPTSVSHGNAM